MNTEDNLWGEIPTAEGIQTPFNILKSQAGLLDGLTRGLLRAELVKKQDGDTTLHGLRVIAPALGNYRKDLVCVSHGVELYPTVLVVLAEEMRSPVNAKDVAELKDRLSQILQGGRIRKILVGLMAQSLAEGAVPKPVELPELTPEPTLSAEPTPLSPEPELAA